jgi:hypothetical protein
MRPPSASRQWYIQEIGSSGINNSALAHSGMTLHVANTLLKRGDRLCEYRGQFEKLCLFTT